MGEALTSDSLSQMDLKATTRGSFGLKVVSLFMTAKSSSIILRTPSRSTFKSPLSKAVHIDM